MDSLAQLLPNILIGLETALNPVNFMYCVLGVVAGMALGVLPGIGPMCQRRSKIRPRGGVKVGHLAPQARNVGRA